jgi:hypothetical protein
VTKKVVGVFVRFRAPLQPPTQHVLQTSDFDALGKQVTDTKFDKFVEGWLANRDDVFDEYCIIGAASGKWFFY